MHSGCLTGALHKPHAGNTTSVWTFTDFAISPAHEVLVEGLMGCVNSHLDVGGSSPLGSTGDSRRMPMANATVFSLPESLAILFELLIAIAITGILQALLVGNRSPRCGQHVAD
jgi:hypothetical protein